VPGYRELLNYDLGDNLLAPADVKAFKDCAGKDFISHRQPFLAHHQRQQHLRLTCFAIFTEALLPEVVGLE